MQSVTQIIRLTVVTERLHSVCLRMHVPKCTSEHLKSQKGMYGPSGNGEMGDFILLTTSITHVSYPSKRKSHHFLQRFEKIITNMR